MQRSGVRDCDCVWPAAARALVPTPNLNTARVTRTARQHSSTRVRLTALARACHVHRLRVPSAPPDAGGRRAPIRGPRLAWLHHACCCALEARSYLARRAVALPAPSLKSTQRNALRSSSGALQVLGRAVHRKIWICSQRKCANQHASGQLNSSNNPSAAVGVDRTVAPARSCRRRCGHSSRA